MAVDGTIGGVQIGYTASGRNYPVELNSEKMYVNVPWTDTNTTYTAGNGLDLNSETFSVDPDQTTITSIKNTGLIIGRDDHNHIDFSTDNVIKFKVNNTDTIFRYRMYGNSFCPYLNKGASLGIGGTAWANLYLGSGGVINFNGDVVLTYSNNLLTLKGGKLSVEGNIYPYLNNTYSLGDSTYRWANLYLGSTATINFNGNVVLTHSSNTLAMTGASSGGFTCDGDITAFKSSDKRLKDNIVKIENPIEKIKKIGGYNFEWNKLGEKHTINKGNDVGVIAQEIEDVLPEATTTRDNGYKAVQYEKIVPLLIECIKDQQNMIENLQGQIDEIKSKII